MMDVFVFGSNLRGRHGAGAALVARRHWGAIYGMGEGFACRSYAIPTKRTPRETLPLYQVADSVARFILFARSRPGDRFLLTRIGCGLAGFAESQIAPLFADAPGNVWLIDDAGSVVCLASEWSKA